MTESDGLICAFLIDDQGNARAVDSKAESEGKATHWNHVDISEARGEEWLRSSKELDPIILDALIADETRPRCLQFETGILLILRGVNLNEGADPEDMVSLRIWMDRQSVISVERRQLMAVRDVMADCKKNKAPKSPAELLYRLARNLANRMEPSINNLEDEVAELEEEIIDTQSYAMRTQISDLRRRAVRLRRYIAPQREALMYLLSEDEDHFSERLRHRMREVAERTTRHVEEIDEVRDRSQILYDDLTGRLSERLDRNMYMLSVIAGIFLPLSLLAGLLGINVDGMPGTKDTPSAFWLVTGGIFVVGLIEYWIARKLRWL